MNERPFILPLAERLTEGEVARYLQVGRGTLKNWRSAGTGPAFYRFGRKVIYKRADVEDYVAGCRFEHGQSRSVTANNRTSR